MMFISCKYTSTGSGNVLAWNRLINPLCKMCPRYKNRPNTHSTVSYLKHESSLWSNVACFNLSSIMMTSTNGSIFPRYLPFELGIHRSPVNFPHKSQWRGALMFSLFGVWLNAWVNNREAVDLRRHCAHYDVIVNLGITSTVYSIRYSTKFRLEYVDLFSSHPLILKNLEWCHPTSCATQGRRRGLVASTWVINISLLHQEHIEICHPRLIKNMCMMYRVTFWCWLILYNAFNSVLSIEI